MQEKKRKVPGKGKNKGLADIHYRDRISGISGLFACIGIAIRYRRQKSPDTHIAFYREKPAFPAI